MPLKLATHCLYVEHEGFVVSPSIAWIFWEGKIS
jgi:hypothetical protein